MRGTVVAMCALLAACPQTFNPCPAGTVPLREEDRCTPVLDGDAMTQEGRDERDGGADGSATDASDDSGLPDAGEEAVCTQRDVQAWTSFHGREGLVDALKACNELCPGQACAESVTCIRQKAQVRACEACTEREGRCVATSCPSACGVQGDDAECRACLCEAGCADGFNACAETSIQVCDGVYGREASEAEKAFERPLAYRQKNGTGLLLSSPLRPYPDEAMSDVLRRNATDASFRRHGSPGFTHLVSLDIEGQPYILEHKSRCGDDPCIARISPALRDGSFGRAAYVAHWSAGWDEIEAFRAGGQAFLLRYKTGASPATEEPRGWLRIERIVRDASTGEVALEIVLDEQATPTAEPGYSSIEVFAHAGATHLLFYRSDHEGEVAIERVRATASSFALEHASSGLAWTRGWDIVETFPLDGQALVLLHKSGLAPLAGEPAGSIRVLGFSGGSGQLVAFSSALHDGTWPTGVTQVIGYADGPYSYLLRSDTVSGATALLRLSELAQLGASLGTPILNADWSATPAYDVLEVVRQQPW
jgi:hypothetical protein